MASSTFSPLLLKHTVRTVNNWNKGTDLPLFSFSLCWCDNALWSKAAFSLSYTCYQITIHLHLKSRQQFKQDVETETVEEGTLFAYCPLVYWAFLYIPGYLPREQHCQHWLNPPKPNSTKENPSKSCLQNILIKTLLNYSLLRHPRLCKVDNSNQPRQQIFKKKVLN